MATKAISVINVPSDIGSIYAGKSKAPSAFRSAGLHDKLGAKGYKVDEYTAFEDTSTGWTASTRQPNGARNEARIVQACTQVKDTVAKALSAQSPTAFQLILAGECLYCPAILSAYWDHLDGTSKRVGMIYMDADCDLDAPGEPASSGNIAGMTLTHLTLRDGALDSMKTFSQPDGSGVADSNNTVLFGLNTHSPTNKPDHIGYLFDQNFRVITSAFVRQAPTESAKVALQWLEERVDCIVVHLDVDVIDPGEFPLCNVPNRTGIGYQEAMNALKVFLGSKKCVALSVAEVNPDHDPGLLMTQRLVSDIVEGLSA